MTREEALKILRKDLLSNLVDYYSSEELQDAIDTIVSQPSLPSNLDEAAEEYAIKNKTQGGFILTENIEGFKAGAEWMASQGKSIESTVITAQDEDTGEPYLVLRDFGYMSAFYKDGDKVIVQIRNKQ